MKNVVSCFTGPLFRHAKQTSKNVVDTTFKSLCSATPYDWTDCGSVDVFSNGECGFTSMRRRCHSTEWVWNLRTKLCSIPLGK